MRTRGIIAAYGVAFLTFGAICAAASSLTDSAIHVPPEYTTMTPPAAGESYVDPVFGTTIQRVTDATQLSEPAIVPEYSQTSAFNVDDTYMVLYWAVDGAFHLYDGSGNYVRWLPVAGGLAEPRWSRSSPDHLYFHSGNRIERLDVNTGSVQTVETFSQYGSITFGRGQGDLSDNERIVVVGDNRYVGIYDLATRTRFGVLDLYGHSFDAAAISKDGNSFVVLFHSGGTRWSGIEQFGLDGNFMAQLQNAPAHFAMGRDIDGSAVMYITNAPTNPQQPAGCDNGVVKISLDGTASRTCLLALDWGMGKHLSAHGGDGWVYVSTYQPTAEPVAAEPGVSDRTKWLPYTNEIFRVRGDGSEVERLAHHRSSLTTYYRQPHATISISGRKLLYGSDFHLDGQHEQYADAYLIHLDDQDSGGEEDPGSVPSSPSQLQGTAYSDPRVDLTWTDNSDDEDAFELLRRGPGETAFHMLAYLGADTRSFQDHDVVATEEYCYQVVAHNAYGGSSPSNTACATPASPPAAPASPTGVETTAMEDPRVDVSWNDNSLDEETFEVERKGPADASFGPIASVPASVVSFSDMEVTSDDEYCYRVMARNANGASDPSEVSCATTPQPLPDPDPPGAPAAPEQLRADQIGDRLVRLTWLDAADDEVTFEIHRSSKGRRYRHIAELDADIESFDDDHVRWKTTFCYRVLAKNAFGTSISDEACVHVRR